MRNVAVAVRTNGSYVQGMVRASIPQRANVVNFKIWLPVAAYEWCRMFAAFTISA
jgi:hypothetical protein